MSLAAAGRAAISPVKPTGSAVLKSAEMVGLAARKSVDISVDAAADAFEGLQSAYNKSMATVFPECPVPAFMLPTGPYADDFVLVFDLEEFLGNLQTGIFVRPKIELWTAKEDGHNVAHLAQEISTRFAEEFNMAMERAVADGQAAVAAEEENKTEALREVGSELSGKTLGSAAFWTAAAALGAGGVALAPLGIAGAVAVPCLMLAVGMRPRTVLFSRIGDYLRARSDSATVEGQFEDEVNRMEKEFKRKSKPFERAVRNLELRIHPQLQDIAESLKRIGETDTAAAAPAPVGDFPDIEPYLRHPVYLQALAERNVNVGQFVDPAEGQDKENRGFFNRMFGSD